MLSNKFLCLRALSKTLRNISRQTATIELFIFIKAEQPNIHMVAFRENPSVACHHRRKVEDKILVLRVARNVRLDGKRSPEPLSIACHPAYLAVDTICADQEPSAHDFILSRYGNAVRVLVDSSNPTRAPKDRPRLNRLRKTKGIQL